MQNINSGRLLFVLKLLTCVSIIKVTAGIVLNYGDYLPPDFDSAFLHGRDT